MRRAHFETYRPICPRCRAADGEAQPLMLAKSIREVDEHIIEGLLHCPGAACGQEYPIIDGVPIIVPSVRQFVVDHFDHLHARRDLSLEVESVLGDCAGPGSAYDYTRAMISSYAWEHYAEFDPDETAASEGAGTSTACLAALLERAGGAVAPPVLDVGCSTGRHAFELAARTDGLVLGVDANFAMLQVAAGVLREGVVRYPRRRVGLVYDRREFAVEFDGAERVDFWLCDGQTLPLADDSIGSVVGMNVLDSVASPLALLESAARVLAPGGTVWLACPYDWSGGATAVEAWIGGHSQRGEDGGDAVARLRGLLAGPTRPDGLAGLELIAEIDDLRWRLRLHDRAMSEYRLHGAIARKV